MKKHPVDEIVGEDGFWKSHTRDTLIDAYNFLINKGAEENRVFALLQNLYDAISGEFGK